MRKLVTVGLVGAGFAAHTHARACRSIPDVDVRIGAVASQRPARAESLAREFGIPTVCADFEGLVSIPEIDIVDLCVPNQFHEPFALAAARAGKHVIIEKPLTGYFGGAGAADPVGDTPRRVMLRDAVRSADAIVDAGRRYGVKIMYAENWVYAPGVQKALELAKTANGTILEIRAEESHSGSHAEYARTWSLAGGGALLRIGSHPMCAVIYLKQQEGIHRNGRPIGVKSVVAEVGDVTRVPSFVAEDRKWLRTGWEDVENWATALLTFDDGTHAAVFGSDIVLGGMRSTLELYLSNARIICDLTRSNLIQAFAPDASVFAGAYLAEKLETKAGWSFPSADEDWMLGYPQEMRDFCLAVADDRPALSDAALGREVVRATYAAYLSAEEGRRVML